MNAEEILSDGFWQDGQTVSFRTSGSTGVAKNIVFGKEALLTSARAVNAWLHVDASSVWGLALPLHHVGGFGVAARANAAGCGFALFEGKWDAVRFGRWLVEKGVTHVSLVPTQVHDLLAAGLEAPPRLRAVVVGGGKFPDEAGQLARDKGWPVLASFGMTEAGSQIATQRIESLGDPFAESPMELLPIWEAEESPEGMLRIRGAALFSGTVEEGVFRERVGEWFTTKDRVRLSGRMLTPLGRADLLVKVLGELVDLEAVERRFLEIVRGAVSEGSFAVIDVPDARRENALLAVFEGDVPEKAIASYQVQAPGLERFSRSLSFGRFPRTELGKLRRGELRRLCMGRDSA